MSRQALAAVIGCLWILLATVGGAQEQAPQQVDRIVAVVNGRVITRADVVQQVLFLVRSGDLDLPGETMEQKMASLQALGDEYFEKILRRMINQEVIYAETQRQEMRLPNSVIENAIAREVGRMAKGDWELYRKLLAQEKLTIEDRRKRLRKDITVRQYLDMMVNDRIHISPAAVRNYYDEHSQDFQIPGRVRLELIIVSPAAHDADTVAARTQAINDGIAADKDFRELAREYSDSPEKERADDIGWLKMSEVATPLREALPGFSRGQITGPVDLNGNFLWIRVAEVESAGTRTFNEVRDRIADRLHQAEAEQRTEELMQRLRKKVAIRMPGQ